MAKTVSNGEPRAEKYPKGRLLVWGADQRVDIYTLAEQ